MRRTILVTLDGLRRDLIAPETMPHLVAFSRRAETFADYRTVFPSCTRVVSASIATGCFPARHELQGNSMVLVENGELVPHDAGTPDFLQHKRNITGRSLAVPTLAERVSTIGGAIVFSNVSPGAAYAHDPDGYGHVYHRAGSFGPGRIPIPEPDALHVQPDLGSDRAMTERFIHEVVFGRRPALGILWLGDPDATQHISPLGSAEHLEALRQSDLRAQEVIEAVEACRARAEDILLMIGSDHGHQTVTSVVDIDQDLVAAGLKDSEPSRDVIVSSNGTSALIYVHPDCSDRLGALAAHLDRAAWAGRIVSADDLHRIGQAPHHQLAFAVSMRANDEPNAYGVRGTSLVAKPSSGKADRLGCGQHGGFGAYEQSPFLMISGNGFAAGKVRETAATVVDIAPTILAHLRLAQDGMDGAALQRRSEG
ncbi:alkaline phosphatase family protein [Bradyrhizobium cenepequi]|uniref:alkaline phosphatase family protein n=1 Tax=Bradyrhizobium cenepequi TaxID=2821403 RepID=UPI001CE3597E|nr:alkaline phosphatase family protein [Bradyrhizobium cenepequi]MCA6111965.1 alkaline phosphatase family protein [Bradyrhizobium cenepequi]